MKQTLQVVVYRSVFVVAYALSLMPMTFLYAMASFIRFLIYNVFEYRKAVVIQNIARSFPDKRYGEIQCIVKKFYACFTAYLAEIVKSISAPVEVLDKKIVFENQELIDGYVNAGRNVIACLGHCGNWEILNVMPFKIQHEMYAVYKPLRSEIMNKLMFKIRSRFGMKLISDKSVIRHILTNQSCPAIYLFLADQCPRIKEENYRFEMLNQQTYVFSGMEKLAQASQSAVIYLHIAQL